MTTHSTHDIATGATGATRGHTGATGPAVEKNPIAAAAEDAQVAASLAKLKAAQDKSNLVAANAAKNKDDPAAASQASRAQEELDAAKSEHDATVAGVKAARDERAKPDTVVGVLVEVLEFANERMHRERQLQPGDAERISSLMARLRALK